MIILSGERNDREITGVRPSIQYQQSCHYGDFIYYLSGYIDSRGGDDFSVGTIGLMTCAKFSSTTVDARPVELLFIVVPSVQVVFVIYYVSMIGSKGYYSRTVTAIVCSRSVYKVRFDIFVWHLSWLKNAMFVDCECFPFD